MDIKKLIANNIKFNAGVNLEELIIESISADKGDYCLPCFALAKTLKQNPMAIANEVANSVVVGKEIQRVEVVAGYVNFFLNKEKISAEILKEFKGKFATSEGANKTVLIDYGSPNLAKYLHIGHLKTIIIGESLARLYDLFGYNTKRLCYTGDYGTPFGMMIAGMFKYGSMSEVIRYGNEALQNYYVKFNAQLEKNPALIDEAREIFKKIENRDSEIYPIYEKIIEIALKEAKQMFSVLGVKFDDFRGEMYYNQFVPKIVKELERKKLLKESEGAKIVDLTPYDLTPSVIIKNDGTSLYTTRDICAVIERNKEYKFDKMLYVTDVAQILNFKQLIKIMELMGYKFYKDMEHVPYGRFSLPDGKISSRRGKQAVLTDLIAYIMDKARNVIKDRHFEHENPDKVVKIVARAVLNYSVLKVERIKDCVFDIDLAFSFDGETAPYMLYTYTRLESILRKYTKTSAKPDYACFDDDAFMLTKYINDFSATLHTSLEKRDISIVCKRVMEMCKTFNHFYTNCKVLDGNPATTNAKIKLVKALKATLKTGFNIMCMDTLKEM